MYLCEICCILSFFVIHSITLSQNKLSCLAFKDCGLNNVCRNSYRIHTSKADGKCYIEMLTQHITFGGMGELSCQWWMYLSIIFCTLQQYMS